MTPTASVRVLLLGFLCSLISCSTAPTKGDKKSVTTGSVTNLLVQTPSWSRSDLDFFLHGSMGTEVLPERVLRAFILTYPELYPSADLTHLGLLRDPGFGWPIGFSRRPVPHLAGLSSVGLNCAACHVAEVRAAADTEPVRLLGASAQFDAEAFFGAAIISTFKTADPANMRRFLGHYFAVGEPTNGVRGGALFEKEWTRQEEKIRSAMKDDPAGSKPVGPGKMQMLQRDDYRLNRRALEEGTDLAATATAFLKLFHNMRTALHIPDVPPAKAGPVSGPGRNDAFGLLSGALFGEPQPYAPVKYGLVWGLEDRRWVHWDGNAQSPIGRNLLASLGLGAPLSGKRGELDFRLVKRHTDMSEAIRAPRYPFATDASAAKRGAAHYQAQCASCHEGPESDKRLYEPGEIGTDPLRVTLFSPGQAERFNRFLGELEIPRYQPSKTPGIRSTQKYWAASMNGVWARAPYLHNGSVRTMRDLLTAPGERPKSFHRGTTIYDQANMGYRDEGAYLLDTTQPGNSNAGHAYGIDLTASQKQDLVEYLKTR